MKAIDCRRSVRNYDVKKVDDAKVEKILRAAMQAPSAVNQQPWEFIVVRDKQTLKEIAQMSPYSKMIEKADGIIITLGNTQGLAASNMWEQDMAAATQNMLLEATELGLGTVWLGVSPLKERMEFIASRFNLASHLLPFSIVVFGYPEKEDANKYIDRFDPTRVHYEKY